MPCNNNNNNSKKLIFPLNGYEEKALYFAEELVISNIYVKNDVEKSKVSEISFLYLKLYCA